MSNGSDNRSFEEKARDFLSDLAREEGFVTVHREIGHDVSGLKVGTGRNSRLVYKNGDVTHAQKASDFYDRLTSHFEERGYEPWSYELIKPDFVAVGERKGVVQVYFDTPSLNELHSYHVMIKEMSKRERKLGRPLNAEEIESYKDKFVRDEEARLRCKQLLIQPHNRDITLEQMTEVIREFNSDTKYLDLWVKQSNVIVLGQRKREDLVRTGLAIIDY
jgi:hypothetical protein